MPSANPLAIFAPGLNRIRAPWMTVGSIASNAYGEPRTTLDVDVVIVIGAGLAHRFDSAFPEEEFYCPPADVIALEADRPEHGHFNLLHHDTGFKADIYISRNDTLQKWAMANRQRLTVDDIAVWLAPPEYVIIHKLEFYREGGSEKHLRDICGMLAVTDVDRALIGAEVEARGLAEAWSRCMTGGQP